MYYKEENEYSFVANKIDYTVENLGNSIEIYETDKPSKTGFVFDDLKQFVLFINRLTDIAESIGDQNEITETL
jgi:hypothetical protein